MAGLLAAVALTGCGEAEPPPGDNEGQQVLEERLRKRLEGRIEVAVPAVLQPLATNAGANFANELRVDVEVSEEPTAVAVDRLCAGAVQVAGSRGPLSAAERNACERNGIEPLSFKAGHHAAGILASEELGIRCLTVDQLRRLSRPGSEIASYAQLGGGLPARPVALFGPDPGRDSFALFTEAINGGSGRVRAGWTETGGRGALSAAVRKSDHALGFGNLSQLRPIDEGELRFVAVDAGSGCIEPTSETVISHRYEPLSEELYLHVSRRALDQLRVRSFMRFLVENYSQLASASPPIEPASEDEIDEARRLLPQAPYPKG